MERSQGKGGTNEHNGEAFFSASITSCCLSIETEMEQIEVNVGAEERKRGTQ
jgi:hypothetical protein